MNEALGGRKAYPRAAQRLPRLRNPSVAKRSGQAFGNVGDARAASSEVWCMEMAVVSDPD